MKRRADAPLEVAIGGWIEMQPFKRILEASEDALARSGQRAIKVEKYVHDELCELSAVNPAFSLWLRL
jgi:hypothetical protein